MEFKGKFAFLCLLAIMMIGCFSQLAQAGSGPCQNLQTSEAPHDDTECQKCCASYNLEMVFSPYTCRCMTPGKDKARF